MDEKCYRCGCVHRSPGDECHPGEDRLIVLLEETEEERDDWKARAEKAEANMAVYYGGYVEFGGEKWWSEGVIHASEDALAASRLEVERLRGLIDRDRTGLAAALNTVRGILDGYSWLSRDEWGSYGWEERTFETLRREIGWMMDAAIEAIEKGLHESGDRANSAFHPEAALGLAPTPEPDCPVCPEVRVCDGPADCSRVDAPSKQPCPKCNDTGLVPCDACAGHGYDYKDGPVCLSCDAEGTVPCDCKEKL